NKQSLLGESSPTVKEATTLKDPCDHHPPFVYSSSTDSQVSVLEVMSSKGKHNSTASTYSSNKKRREHGLSPSSNGQPESVAQASPGEKSKNPQRAPNHLKRQTLMTKRRMTMPQTKKKFLKLRQSKVTSRRAKKLQKI
ncbi:hypothetical protein PSTT_14910, partial [Puccinia striiformis]